MDAKFGDVLLAVSGFLLTYFLNKASKDLSALRESVEQLNVRIAVVVERVDSHEKRLARLEDDDHDPPLERLRSGKWNNNS